MKKTIGHFLAQSSESFPIDCELLNSIQENSLMVEVLGNIAGDKTILMGCEGEENGAKRKEGFVFLRTQDYPNGEVLYYEGGNVNVGMYIKKQDISAIASGTEYPKAYTVRSLSPGIGEENYAWKDFTNIKTNKDLQEADIKHDLGIVEVGSIILWPGVLGSMPHNYAVCNGQVMDMNQYPLLFSKIQKRFTSGPTQGDEFLLPKLPSINVPGIGANEALIPYAIRLY